MRLIELRANKESFHTVTFNRTGLSIIQARRNNPTDITSKKTYNSVGKSLTIRIVHFCLGCAPIPEFESKLPDWEFYLDFEITGKKYTASRKTTDQKQIFLNGEGITLNKFRENLQDKLFPELNVKFVSFRSLISRFIRPKKNSYVSYDNFIQEEEEYARLCNNAYLLGLNTDLVVNKINLKNELEKVEESKRNIEKDPIIKGFFNDIKTSEVEVVHLEDQIRKLEIKIKEFVIAENYDAIKKEADQLSYEIKQLQNKSTLVKNAINNIEKSLKYQPDIPKEKIYELYQEVNIEFGELVKKRFDELESFNKNLVKNRNRRLNEEKRRFEDQLMSFNNQIKKLGAIEDEKLSYLNKYGALGDYSALTEQLSNMRLKLEKLKTHRDLINSYKNKIEEIKIGFGKGNIETNNYLAKNSIIDQNIAIFKNFAQEFYENKKSGIDVLNNESQNKIRFDIFAKIQDDAGDGVNEVKIFCFDWTLLKARHNHSCSFIFHDSRLLSDMDSRQVAILFETAYMQTKDNNLQYIISANENMLNTLKDYFNEEEYKNIINNNIILELTDESDETKLLGIQVDMDYEKD